MSASPTLVWFRQDLRLDDNPALLAAVARGGLVVPVFIWSPDEEGEWAPGAASRWWLHQSLASLDASLRQHGSRLLVRRGPTLPALLELARATGAGAVVWNRRYEPAVIVRDAAVKTALKAAGLEATSYNSALLFEPWDVQNREGKPFQVFTPFWKACLARPEPPRPLAAPRELLAPKTWPDGLELQALDLQPPIDWVWGMRDAWKPGEVGAAALLAEFLADAVRVYAGERDRPDRRGTSRLSPHLHFGEVSPRRVWHETYAAIAAGLTGEQTASAEWFLREVGWREFAHHLLFHFPHTPSEPLRADYKHFPWETNPTAFKAWKRGRTGYPIVDAGLRELWTTGWMHNRVRMIVASFLVKDLLISWLEGARWFWDTLVDADLANNTLGWQWTGGCGADAAPYFRVFNPVTQGEKFDTAGGYVRRWVPELAKLPDEWLHRPWEAPPLVLAGAGVYLGKTYPRPIVEHGAAREKALAALATLKK